MSSDTQITIGIADDNSIFREGLHKTIAAFDDLTIVVSEDDIDALFAHINSLPQPPDVCIIDISMSGSYQALKRMKEEFPDVKVLVLSSLNNELNIIRTIKIGANGFMLKGFTPQELHRALRSVHETGDFINENYNSVTREKITQESLTFHLSYLELDMLSKLCMEWSMKEIVSSMNISPKEGEKIREALYKKIKVKDRVELVLFAIHVGLLNSSQTR